jgi:hypothetical protein
MSMTAKRDLKKRVRERQARTGERYTTARRHIVREPSGAVPVVELEDITKEAARLGFHCRVVALPDLFRRVDRNAMLERIRDALRATGDDPATALLRSAVLQGIEPALTSLRPSIQMLTDGRRFIDRAEAGIGGVSPGGRLLALAVPGRRGLTMVLCGLWSTHVPGLPHRPASLILTTPGALTLETLRTSLHFYL